MTTDAGAPMRGHPTGHAMRSPALGRSRYLEAAAVYNAVWGAVAIVAPQRLASAVGFSPEGDGMGWRAAGVVVLAYAPAYLWASRRPASAVPILAIAFLGKSIGAVGWLVGLATGRFRPRTIALPLLNDVIWLPGLAGLLRRARARPERP